MSLRRYRFSIFDVLNHLVLTLLTLACILPFWYLFINTISGAEEIARGRVILLPHGIHLQNYLSILGMPTIWRAALISIARTVLGTSLTVFCCTLFGYLLAQEALPMRKSIYRFVVVTMFFNAGLIPWFLTMRMLGMQNNFLLYILPSAVIPFYLVLLKTYIEQTIPRSIEESALMDGAGYFQIFGRIIIPLSTPIVATVAVFAAVGQWNSFTDTLFLVRDQSLMTLQMQLYKYLQQVEAVAAAIRSGGIMAAVRPGGYMISPLAVRMTVSMVVVFPILIVYPVLQRYFIKGIMIGAIKG
jgi:putative aldouronate transport system permease protein